MAKVGRGGCRDGAGRPTGSGRFGDEPLAKVALPVGLRDEVIRFVVAQLAKRDQQEPQDAEPERSMRQPVRNIPSPSLPYRGIPLYQHGVRAGMTSDADSDVERDVDLNTLLVRDGTQTFMLRVEGDSMTGAGIFDDDMLVVDRSIQARHGDIVIALLNETEFTCKRLHQRTDRLALLPENPAYPPIEIGPQQELRICGVVTGVIRKLR